MIKGVLEINGGGGPEASLLKFIPGRIIEMPDIKPHTAHLLDAEVARYFFHSMEHFYAAALEEIEATIEKLDREFLRPELRHLQQKVSETIN